MKSCAKIATLDSTGAAAAINIEKRIILYVSGTAMRIKTVTIGTKTSRTTEHRNETMSVNRLLMGICATYAPIRSWGYGPFMDATVPMTYIQPVRESTKGIKQLQ